jgi:multicomponent Na+:H+ antiporter subunit E
MTSAQKRSLTLAVSWVALVIAWMALWGEVSLGNLAAGGALGAVVLLFLVAASGSFEGTLRPMHALRFFVVVSVSLVKATLVVAWEVLTPRNRVREGILAIPLPETTPLVLVAVTNAIGLTPGTVVVEIDEDEPHMLYVHVLHIQDVDTTRAELLTLCALTLRAFGTDAGVDAADELDRRAAALSDPDRPRAGEVAP